MGEALSVLDIAWFIYAHRLSLAGYPLSAAASARSAPGRKSFAPRPEFAKEIAMPADAKARIEATHRAHAAAGKTLEAVAGF